MSPYYDFQCANGHISEEYHKITEIPHEIKCKQCELWAQRVILETGGFILAGGCWSRDGFTKNSKS